LGHHFRGCRLRLDTVRLRLEEPCDGLLVTIEPGLDRYREVPLFVISNDGAMELMRQILRGVYRGVLDHLGVTKGNAWPASLISIRDRCKRQRNNMIRVPKLPTVFLCFALTACTTIDKYSFIRYGQTPNQTTHQFEATAIPPLSDVLALNYASSVASILRCKFNGARIAREISSTAQVALAAFAGAGAAFHYSASTVTALGLGSAGIPELQKIFDAKGRAQAYQDAVRLIEEAEIEYLALNQRPSPTVLTQNGVTLFQRVTASIHVVEKTLAGNLPSVEDMQKATERMSESGATKTAAGSTPSNLIPANGKAPIRKLEPVVIEKTVQLSEGLQADDVHVITKASGTIIRAMELPEAQQAVSSLTGDKTPDPEAKATLVKMNSDTKITAQRATQILAAVQAAKK
jgi:hypothetical protein